ncbi:hypothetical protein BKH46_08850 [Helicobacter sp. 12S02634-8]|uniref:phage late control D family protein n=1 Tax=Helicobacter sp. 12S02634-8 TaxID=1476199 RepID=UPI000BD0BECB|nr:contractile injection system protein, VgrG/Pvc8 family [Helicobacter sp. 12S02634-8]PAF46145.1 hypothetical protein BKH46_08850 [Helicobacter sp. 12S02634-8]
MPSVYSAPQFNITHNGADISNLIMHINYEDFEGEKSDTLKLKLYPRITPKLKDKIIFSINGTEMGSFYVASIAYAYQTSYEIQCTSIDFSAELRTKKSRSFHQLSYQQIIESIAKENDLTPKINFARMHEITHLDQIDQSDASFLHKIARELNLTYTIKNDTLIFLEKKSDKKPTITINAEDCASLSIESYAKLFYKSVEVAFIDPNNQQAQMIRIGQAEPTLKRTIHAKNADEAYKRAEGYYKALQNDTKKGTLELAGRIIYAGALLNLKGNDEVSGQYVIKKITHNIDSSGWRASVEFGG